MPLSGDLSFYINPPGYDDPTVLVSSGMSYTTNRCIRVYMILCTRSGYWGWRGGEVAPTKWSESQYKMQYY